MPANGRKLRAKIVRLMSFSWLAMPMNANRSIAATSPAISTRLSAMAYPASNCRAMTFSSRIGFTPSKIGSTSASATNRAIGSSSE